MTLRKELGDQTPARTVPYLPIPIPHQEQESGEQTSPVKRLLQEDKLSQGSRGPGQLLPIDVPPTEFGISNDSFLSPRTQFSYNLPANISRSHPSGKVSETEITTRSGRPLPQGCVLHAPPSAYPQVMPGSLPSPSPDRLQDPICARPAWRISGQHQHQQVGLRPEESLLP